MHVHDCTFLYRPKVCCSGYLIIRVIWTKSHWFPEELFADVIEESEKTHDVGYFPKIPTFNFTRTRLIEVEQSW